MNIPQPTPEDIAQFKNKQIKMMHIKRLFPNNMVYQPPKQGGGR